jgi:Zn-dependent protease with chaperone function
VLAASIIARLLYCVAAGWSTTRRRRRRQRHGVQLIAHRHASSGALVVPHDSALVYCLPGKRGQVVLTSGAIDALDEAELTAVLAHERAHLRMRHDTVLAAASALSAAFPFGLFAVSWGCRLWRCDRCVTACVGTAEIIAVQPADCDFVGPVGLEPTTRGLKVRCSAS